MLSYTFKLRWKLYFNGSSVGSFDKALGTRLPSHRWLITPLITLEYAGSNPAQVSHVREDCWTPRLLSVVHITTWQLGLSMHLAYDKKLVAPIPMPDPRWQLYKGPWFAIWLSRLFHFPPPRVWKILCMIAVLCFMRLFNIVNLQFIIVQMISYLSIMCTNMGPPHSVYAPPSCRLLKQWTCRIPVLYYYQP